SAQRDAVRDLAEDAHISRLSPIPRIPRPFWSHSVSHADRARRDAQPHGAVAGPRALAFRNGIPLGAPRESVTMLLCWWAGVRLLKSYRADRAQFAAALNVAVIALTTSLLMWLVAFLDVGGEWFLMWQSTIWNGQEEAFRMFTIVGMVFLVLVQREPTPDSSAILLLGGPSRFPVTRE